MDYRRIFSGTLSISGRLMSNFYPICERFASSAKTIALLGALNQPLFLSSVRIMETRSSQHMGPVMSIFLIRMMVRPIRHEQGRWSTVTVAYVQWIQLVLRKHASRSTTRLERSQSQVWEWAAFPANRFSYLTSKAYSMPRIFSSFFCAGVAEYGQLYSLIGLYGGLTIVFQWICPILVQIFFKLCMRTRNNVSIIDNAAPTWQVPHSPSLSQPSPSSCQFFVLDYHDNQLLCKVYSCFYDITFQRVA